MPLCKMEFLDFVNVNINPSQQSGNTNLKENVDRVFLKISVYINFEEILHLI